MRNLPRPQIETVSPALAGGSFFFFPSLDKIGSPPDSSAHRIFQARILEYRQVES